MGFGSERDDEGRLVLTMAFDATKMGRPGFLHGGAIAGMLETVAFMTLSEALGDEDTPHFKPVNVTVTFMRGGVDRLTYARATLSRLGRRIANIEAVAWQDDADAPIAVAQLNVKLDRR
jgi:uncharacterized protein (TIGR00369 family)